MAKKNFPFIVLSGPKVDDPKARRIIRKQAMKDVGEARKQRGCYGKVNMRQMPVFDDNGTNIRVRLAVNSDSDSSNSSPEYETTNGDSSDPGDVMDLERGEETALTVQGQGRRRPVGVLHEDGGFSFAAINLFSNYESIRAKFNVDLADLSILTNFNGRTPCRAISYAPLY
jgi:hypothetical protein